MPQLKASLLSASCSSFVYATTNAQGITASTQNTIDRVNSVPEHKVSTVALRSCVLVSPTLDGPLEEGLAGLTGRHAVVVPRSHVAADQAHPLGHSSQHELTLHWALFFPKPSP